MADFVRILSIMMMLSSVIFSINATGTTYSIGRFTLGAQGGIGDSGDTSERHLVTAFTPSSDMGESTNYSADVGFFDDVLSSLTGWEKGGVFIAASISLVGILLFFILLYYKSRNWLWKSVWLMGGLFTIYLSLVIMRSGFIDAVGMESLNNLAFIAMQILMYCIILLFGWLLLQLMYRGLKALIDAANGKKGDDMGIGGGT